VIYFFSSRTLLLLLSCRCSHLYCIRSYHRHNLPVLVGNVEEVGRSNRLHLDHHNSTVVVYHHRKKGLLVDRIFLLYCRSLYRLVCSSFCVLRVNVNCSGISFSSKLIPLISSAFHQPPLRLIDCGEKVSALKRSNQTPHTAFAFRTFDSSNALSLSRLPPSLY